MTVPRSARKWPWFVWGAVVLGLVLLVLAVLSEAKRVYRMKQERINSGYLRAPGSVPGTNAPP